MKRIVALSLAAILAVSAPALAQEGALTPEAMQEAMMKAATPGEHHQHLAKLAGDFTYTAKAWMAPGAPPQEWTGNRSAKMILGGRFLEEHFDGSFAGMPFEGRGLFAYDNAAGHYTYLWCDNMGTMVTTSTGTCSEAGWEMKGTHRIPGTNAENAFRNVLRMVDDNTVVFEWHEAMPGGGEPFKMIEITYKRK
jgi:hypothetical protein